MRIILLAGLVAGVSAFVARPSVPSSMRRSVRMAAGEHALIIQNKGGGHGEIGYHLALTLAKDKKMKVTVLNDKYSDSKVPFKNYGDLTAAGVEVIPADLATADVASLLGGKKFDYVYDNFAKNVDLAKPVASLAQDQKWPVKTYVFVSSGGMYDVADQFPLLETDPVKDSNDARQIEKYLAATGLPYTFFRPQYIYGPLTNKRDYLDWFFDRVVRGRPLPLPKHGEQFTTLTHVGDVASLLASVVDNPKARNQIFNAATDRYVTFKEVCRLVGATVGKEAKVVSYDPSKHKADLPKGFWPFRNTHFNVCPEKAKVHLNWAPKHDLAQDLKEYYKGYLAAGLDKKEMSFEVDDKLIGA